MARCLALEDFSVEEDEGRCVVVLEAWEERALDTFGRILAATFPSARFQPQTTSQGGFLELQESLCVVGDLPPDGTAEIEEFLRLLAGSLTIEDSLDESHALAYHQDQDELTGKLAPSRLGRLVREAKYDTSRPARERIGEALIRFVTQHPRYRRADAIASIPPHEAGTTSGLSIRLVRQVVAALELPQITIERVRSRPAQKDITDEDRSAGVRKRLANQRRSMRFDGNLSGLSAIVVDDLYGSGGTMEEAARALREAGAEEVLGLCVTKQRLYGGVSIRAQNR